MKRPPFHTAFTITELMVAIALVTVIASLGFLGIGQFRREAVRIKCVNNLRQYGTALLAYVGEHQNRIPGESPNFNSMLVPRYLKETLRCPLMQDPKESGLYYTGNHGLHAYYPMPLLIPAPHHRVVFAAESYHNASGFWSPTHFNMTVWGVREAHAGDSTAREANSGGARRPQHHGTPSHRKLNLFFLDGHIESLAPKNNDWWLPSAQGGLYTASPNFKKGIFYERNQFRLISVGLLPYD